LYVLVGICFVLVLTWTFEQEVHVIWDGSHCQNYLRRFTRRTFTPEDAGRFITEA
jgi:hypothetical protein